MKYIIEDRSKLNEQEGSSYLIEYDKVRYVNQRLNRLLYIRLNVQPFTLSPGKIMHSFSIENASIKEVRNHLSALIRLGCTTVISMCTVQRINELKKAVAQMRHQLINSTIDYLIGVRIPFTQLSPALIRLCKREKLPLIHLQISSPEEIESMAWEWIRDALAYYRLVIVPEYCSKSMTTKEIIQANLKWNSTTKKFQIPTTEKRFEEGEPYDRLTLQKIGLYPLKSVLMVGSDVDYYLSHTCKEEESQEVAEVVVLRGRVIKAGERIFYSAGFGREIIIKLPGRFQELASSTANV